MGNSELCLYSGNHCIPIYQRNGYSEDRNLSIFIFDYGDKLQIKLRDMSEYSFNYTEYLDMGDFEVIRVNQSLDINYSEFKTNIVDMFQQFQRKEMLIKCQLNDKSCTIVFYTKSKIKNIVFLTLELSITDQKEIVSEMYTEIHDLQETNRRLKRQLSKATKTVQDKECEVQELESVKKLLMNQFSKDLYQIENIFTTKITNIQGKMLHKISSFTNQISNLQKQINILKEENNLKANSSDRLIRTMENLRLETMENAQTIQKLQKENHSLGILRVNLEKNIADLKRSLDEVLGINKCLEKKKGELEKDLEKLSIIVTQKDSKINELSKDLVQANNMLVGFNNHYDNKTKQVEELQEALMVKEKLLGEEKIQKKQLLQSFEQYKTAFNHDKFESINRDLSMAHKKVQDLEEEIRKLNKINALLTQRVSQGYFNVK